MVKCTTGNLEIQTSNSLFTAWHIAFNKTTSKEKILRHEACKQKYEKKILECCYLIHNFHNVNITCRKINCLFVHTPQPLEDFIRPNL
jgi:hypothetical protein